MPVIIRVTADVAKATAMLTRVERKQLPFAVAMALTDVAKAAKAQVQAELPSRFHIRTPWVARGIQIRAAQKAPGGPNSLTAAVLSRDRFMGLQELGGQRDKGAVPIGARPFPSITTPRSRWPAALLRRRGYFIGPVGERYGVFQRLPDHSRKLMYLFEPTVRVRPRFQMRETVEAVVVSQFPSTARYWIARALATAK